MGIFAPPRSRAAATALVACLLSACSGAPSGPAETVGSTSQAITTSTILSRADEWVTAKLLYCQSPNHQSDTIDPSCPSTCTRTDNAAWDPYRSDCSGFISWAWGLAAPGRTTSEFAPADTSVSYAIDGADLQPGDALNVPSDHIILFVGWQTPGSVANFYEEPGCDATPNYAHAFSSQVTISGQSVYVDYEGMTFTAIRFNGVTGADGGAAAGSGTGSGSGAGGTGCYSDTLGREVPMNTCVQSASDGNWYQCDDGSWTDRYTDPAACVAVYPLGDAGVDAGGAGGAVVGPDAASSATGDAAAGDEIDGGAAGSSGTACAAAGGACVSGAPATCVGGELGPQSCGLGAESVCCVPSSGTSMTGVVVDSGAKPPHSSTPAAPGASTSDGGRASGGDASLPGEITGGAASAGGCSVASTGSSPASGEWVFATFALVLAGNRRRRRASRLA